MAKEKKEEPTTLQKMRIRLLDSNGAVYSDRLVSQGPEFTKGPSEKIEHGAQIEFTLTDKLDAEAAKTYLDQLMLELPITAKSEKKVYKKKSVGLLDKEPIKELYEDLVFKAKDQDQLIKSLRALDFVFLTPDFMKLFEIPVEIHEKHLGYQFMVRAIKIAKSPKADKYDPQLIFAFKLGKKRVENVKVYMYGKFYKNLALPWPKEGKDINYTKKELLVFPQYMNEDERMRFSIEHMKLKNNPELPKSKFYTRWEPTVKLR